MISNFVGKVILERQESGEVLSKLKQRWESFPRFKQPRSIGSTRKCTGYLFVGCVSDTQLTVRFNYRDHVDKHDRRPMTARVSARPSVVRSLSVWSKGATVLARNSSTIRLKVETGNAIPWAKATGKKSVVVWEII